MAWSMAAAIGMRSFIAFLAACVSSCPKGGGPLEQVLTALRKATVICEDVFGLSDCLLVHLQRFVWSSRFELRDSLRALCEAGIALPDRRDSWVEAVDETDDFGAGFWVNCAFEVPTSSLQSLLWCALATNFTALRPNPHCQVYLVDAASGILVHPYDDRGMDIICRHSSRLQGLYRKHNRWLLDRDREAMAMGFDAV